MRSLREFSDFITFSIPIFMLLVTYSLDITISKVVSSYGQKITNDYSIVVVSHTPLIKEEFDEVGGIEVSKFESISRDKIVETFKDKLSSSSIELLQSKLPYFYKIYLDSFPTSRVLKRINEELKYHESIKRVETFSKNHSTIYSLMILIQKVINVLLVVVISFALFLLSKQLELWFYRHKERLDIMQLHGASVVSSFAPIIKISFFSSLLASVVVILLNMIFLEDVKLFFSSELMQISSIDFDIKSDSLRLFALSMVISFISVVVILYKHKKR
jgi:cell division transport system permease protein